MPRRLLAARMASILSCVTLLVSNKSRPMRVLFPSSTLPAVAILRISIFILSEKRFDDEANAPNDDDAPDGEHHLPGGKLAGKPCRKGRSDYSADEQARDHRPMARAGEDEKRK